MNGWRNVSKAEPCPICGRPGWCSVTDDGVMCMCRRVDDGTGEARQDKSGADFWLYRLKDTPKGWSLPPISHQPDAPLASVEDRDRVYRHLLGVLRLEPAHRADLERRGLTVESISEGLYRSLGAQRAELARRMRAQFTEELLLTVPGFYVKEGSNGQKYMSFAGSAGLVVPVMDRAGHVVALKVRDDSPDAEPKYTYITSKSKGGPGPGAAVHVPRWEGDTKRVRATEGEVKAAVATQLSDTLTISTPGVSCWAKLLPVLEEVGAEDIVLSFDADQATNPHVQRAAENTAKALIEKGYRLFVESWHASLGNGIDDVLAAGHVPTFSEVGAAPSFPSDTPATVPPAPIEPPELAHDQHILERFKADVRRCGVVGEETTAATVYLAATSRLLGGPGSFSKPVSLTVKGHSSSGKSFTTSTTMEFFPPGAFIEMTAMSERALVYSKETFKHRTLVLYEAVALREGQQDNLTAYFVRSLLSEGRIEYPVTVRDKDGNFTTKTIRKEGPTNLILTTTKVAIHAENETRALSLLTDDSRDQTRRVFAELAGEDRHAVDLEEWHQLQAWLLHAEHRATIPYAARLAELVPPVAVRLRRDFGAVLALIRAHAILHQLNRNRDAAGRIVATLADYEAVRELVADVVSEGVGATVSPAVRETVDAVKAHASDKGITAVALSPVLNLDKSAVRRRLLSASAGGFVRNLEERRGQAGRWVVAEPMPEEGGLLPPPHHLTAEETAGRKGGGTVAGDSDGIERGVVDGSAAIRSGDPAAQYGLGDPGPCSRCGERTGRTDEEGQLECSRCWLDRTSAAS